MPRSGTGWLSKSLRSTGSDRYFTHERFWSPNYYDIIGPDPRNRKVPPEDRPMPEYGDVSWLALPDLEERTPLWDRSLPPGRRHQVPRIVHVMRSPYPTIASLVANKFWEKDNRFTRFARLNLRTLPDTDDPYILSAYFWCEWQLRCLNLIDVEHLRGSPRSNREEYGTMIHLYSEYLMNPFIEVSSQVHYTRKLEMMGLELDPSPGVYNHRSDYDLPRMWTRVKAALESVPGYDDLLWQIALNAGVKPDSWPKGG